MGTTSTRKKNRTRRTPEQMVADLEAKIEDVKTRAARKAAKQSPEGKAFLAASRAASKALAAAQEAGDKGMAAAVQAALGALAKHAREAGLEAGPKAA